MDSMRKLPSIAMVSSNADFTNSTDAAFKPYGTATVGLDPGVTQNHDWVVFQIVFYVCVIVFGIFGNGLIIRVYSVKLKRGVKMTTAVLLTALALSDLSVCVFRFRNLAILHAYLVHGPVSPVILYLEIPDKFVIATTVSLTGLIAFDRYDCVCRPHNRLLKYRGTLVAAVGCFLFSVVANLPLMVSVLNPSISPLLVGLLTSIFQLLAFTVVFVTVVVCYCKVYSRIRQHVKVGVGRIEVRPRQVPHPDTGAPKISPQLASTLTSTYPTGGTHLTVLDTSTPPCSTTSIPGVASDTEPLRPSGSNSSTVPVVGRPATSTVGNLQVPPCSRPGNSARLRPAEACREQPAEASSSRPTGRPDGQRLRHSLQRKTTRMLFITSVVFLITWLPQGVFVGTRLAGGNNGEVPVSSDAVFNLKPVLFFNNVVNPVIYGLANRRFRQDCVDVLKRLKSC